MLNIWYTILELLFMSSILGALLTKINELSRLSMFSFLASCDYFLRRKVWMPFWIFWIEWCNVLFQAVISWILHHSNANMSFTFHLSRSKRFYWHEVSHLLWTLCRRVRFHYGHPDVFDRLFHLTRGGVSKASKVINLSEDIFAGIWKPTNFNMQVVLFCLLLRFFDASFRF